MKAKLFVAVTAIVVATAMSPAHATTFTYSLNGSYAEDSNSGPSLVPYGGTLGPTGYYFGPNTGLSLSDAVTANGPYSIDIRFYFDSLTGVTNTGYQRILDFRDRTSDSGLYSYQDGSLQLFASSYHPGLPPSGPSLGDPHASAGQVFSDGTMVDLLLTRDATGLFSAYADGTLAFSVMDLTGATSFSGPNNIIWFFVDDLQSLYFYPNTPEAGSGFIDSITVTSDVAAVPVPEPTTLALLGSGLLGLIMMRRRKNGICHRCDL
jgi:PEP-CTERM motif